MKTGVSYFARTRYQHLKEDMAAIKRNNCSYVVHTYSESDKEFCKGTIEKLIKFSHDAGLEVWLDPWGVGGVFGGESYSAFASRNLDARQISTNGDSLPVACFNNGKFKTFMKEWIDSAIEVGADNIFWDEPHFYIYYKENLDEKIGSKLWACRCESCKKLFKKKYSSDMPSIMDVKVQEFKEESIVDFIKEMAGYVKIKGLENSFCFLPVDGPIGGVRNWDKFASIEPLDIIGTDPYWATDRKITAKELEEKVSTFSKKIKTLCDKYGKEPQIWILNFNIKRDTEENIKLAVKAAYKEGIRNLAAWSYYGTEMMGSLSCERPDEVWKTLGQAYNKAIKDSKIIAEPKAS